VSIVNSIKTGSEKVFTEVFHQYHEKLYGYFLKKTGLPFISTELVQIAFIKLWDFKHTLQDDLSFDSQLFNIARTCFIDYLRRQSVRNTRVVIYQQNLSNTAVEIQPHSILESSDYINLVVQSLPPVRKKVFSLHRIQGFSYKEIASHLSISVKTVEDHMAKAIKHIRALTSLF
jgi:RNA polymerase sigma factor (sigma-70 family)